MDTFPKVRQVLRMPHVKTKLGVSRTTIYAWLDPKSRYFDETFPKPIRIGAKSIGWESSRLDSWLDGRLTSNGGIQ